MTDKWNGEEWVEFTEVLAEEAGGLMSHREAERTLRKLCASGVVRAIQVYEDVHPTQGVDKGQLRR